MRYLLILALFLVSLPLNAAISYANTQVRLHMPTSGSWTPGQYVQWRYTVSRPNGLYTTCVDNTQTVEGFFNLGQTASHNGDACLPLTFNGSVQYRFSGGATLWTNANGGGQDWYIGPVPIPEASVCITNTTQVGGVWTLQYGDPPVRESMTMMPGDYWCVDSEDAFILSITEIFGSLQGPPVTNDTPIFSWTPSQGSTNYGGTIDKTPSPVNTQNGAFPSPTNDTQKAANGIVGQLQNNQQQENLNANRIAGLLEEIRDKVATNSPSGDAHTNLGVEASSSSAGVVSNATFGYYNAGTGSVMTAISGAGGSVAPVDLPVITIPIGENMEIEFNPFASSDIVALRNWLQRLILYTAKLVAILYLFRALCMALKDFAGAMKGNGTSGFLQAAFVSVPNLFSSLGGFALRWKIVAFALPTIFLGISGYIVQLNTIDNMPTDFSGLVPSNTKLGWGWSWFVYLVPIEVLFRILVTTLTAHLMMIFTVFAASIITDATSKA